MHSKVPTWMIIYGYSDTFSKPYVKRESSSNARMCFRLTFYQVPRTNSQRRLSLTRPQQSRSSCQSSAPSEPRTTRKFPRVGTVLRSSCTQPQLTLRSSKRITQEGSPIRMDSKTPVGLRRIQEGIIWTPCSNIVIRIFRSLPRKRRFRI